MHAHGGAQLNEANWVEDRNTVDIDFWIAVNPENAAKMTELIRKFGFNVPGQRTDFIPRPA